MCIKILLNENCGLKMATMFNYLMTFDVHFAVNNLDCILKSVFFFFFIHKWTLEFIPLVYCTIEMIVWTLYVILWSNPQ